MVHQAQSTRNEFPNARRGKREACVVRGGALELPVKRQNYRSVLYIINLNGLKLQFPLPVNRQRGSRDTHGTPFYGSQRVRLCLCE
jgi:hypothetical protein